MVKSREDGLVGGRYEKGSSVSPCTRAWWLALQTFAVGCSAEPHVNDPVVNESVMDDTPAGTTTTQPSGGTAREAPRASLACEGTRIPITDPDRALLDTLDRLVGSYPIGGAWGAPAQLDFTPQVAPFEGALVVNRRQGDLFQLEECTVGIEVPVAVSVQTDDGALAESVEGIVLLTNQGDMTVDGAPAPFRAELSAFMDLGALSGSFAFADDPTWTFGKAALRAELTPFGTRGTLNANIEPKEPYDPGTVVVQPSLEPLLTWNGGGGCAGSPGSDPEPALFPAPTEARAALDAALQMASAETYRAKYADGTETRVAVEFAPLTLLCATPFPRVCSCGRTLGASTSQSV